jgi:DNA-binding MarR family transcriptional regulator
MRTTPPVPDLASRLRLDISRMARRLRQEAGAELSPSQTAALATIERHGPLTPSELADRDRRSSLVSISGDGRALLQAARARKDAYLSRRIDALETSDREALERAAAILERMLKESGE